DDPRVVVRGRVPRQVDRPDAERRPGQRGDRAARDRPPRLPGRELRMAGTPVTSFKKAYIESALGDKVEAWFNPKEFSLTRTNKWTMKAVSGQAHPPGPQFGGSEPQKV